MQHTVTTEDIRDLFTDLYHAHDEVTDWSTNWYIGDPTTVVLHLDEGIRVHASATVDEDGWNAAVYASAADARDMEYMENDGGDNIDALRRLIAPYIERA